MSRRGLARTCSRKKGRHGNCTLPFNADPGKDRWTTLERFFLIDMYEFGLWRRTKHRHMALRALCQAVASACALDEHLARGPHKQLYEGFRKRHQFGAVIDGVRRARNVLVHRFHELFYLTGGAALPMELPAPFFEYRWITPSKH